MSAPANLLNAVSITLALSAGAAHAVPHAFTVTREAPGVQHANSGDLCAALGVGDCTLGVETFDSRRNGSFTTDFGITSGYTISGRYSNVSIYTPDVYGGADGLGRYAVTFSSNGYALDLATTNPAGINYFGFWLSALDRGNFLQFYSAPRAVNERRLSRPATRALRETR